MLTSEILDLINEVENRFPVATWTVDKINVWPLIRIRLNFDIYYAHHTLRTSNRRSIFKRYSSAGIKIISNYYKFAKALLADQASNASIPSCSDVVFLSDGISFTKINGKWYEKFCDPLIDFCRAHKLSYSLLTLGSSYFAPRRTPSRFIQPIIDAIRISTVFKSRIGFDFSCYLPDYEEFSGFIAEKNIGVTAPDLNKLFQQVGLINGYSTYFRAILAEIKPKAACVVSYYGTEGMAFNLACRQLGIPSIDLQHGLQGDLHVAYGRWNKVPITGYELLPSYFWCWNQSDVEAIEKWSRAVSRYHQPIFGGNPWLNIWKQPDSSIVIEHDRQIETFMSSRSAVKRVVAKILVTLQFDLDDHDTLAPLLMAMSRSDDSWFWWIRLHPCMLHKREHIRKMFLKSGNENFELDMATDAPLYALLRHSDVHVTHSSSTVIEAEVFGVPSVIFSAYGAEFFPEQIAAGWALVAEADHVVQAITQQLSTHPVSMSFTSPEQKYDGLQIFLGLLN